MPQSISISIFLYVSCIKNIGIFNHPAKELSLLMFSIFVRFCSIVVCPHKLFLASKRAKRITQSRHFVHRVTLWKLLLLLFDVHTFIFAYFWNQAIELCRPLHMYSMQAHLIVFITLHIKIIHFFFMKFMYEVRRVSKDIKVIV